MPAQGPGSQEVPRYHDEPTPYDSAQHGEDTLCSIIENERTRRNLLKQLETLDEQLENFDLENIQPEFTFVEWSEEVGRILVEQGLTVMNFAMIAREYANTEWNNLYVAGPSFSFSCYDY